MNVWPPIDTLVRTNTALGADSPYHDLFGHVVELNLEDGWIFVKLWSDQVSSKPTGFKPDELIVLMEPVDERLSLLLARLEKFRDAQ